jgi:hypothetical protein
MTIRYDYRRSAKPYTPFPKHAFSAKKMWPPRKKASSAALDAKLNNDEWLWIVDPMTERPTLSTACPLCPRLRKPAYKAKSWSVLAHDCHRDELFTAVRRGAFMNETHTWEEQERSVMPL